MNAGFWRTLLLTFCALGFALCAVGPDAALKQSLTISGVILSSAHKPGFLTIAQALPGSPAAHAGMRAGQIIDTRLMSPSDRYRLYYPAYHGQPLTLYVVRASRIEPVQFASLALNLPLRWDAWLGYAGIVWMLAFAAVLAVRRPDDRGACILAGLLIAMVFEALLLPGNWISPFVWLDALAYALSFVFFVPLGLLSSYALLFARPPSTVRLVLSWLSYAVASACALAGISFVASQWFGTFDPSLFATPWASFAINSAPFVLPVVCGLITAAQARGAERSRFLWAFVPLAFMFAGNFFDNAWSSSFAGGAFHIADNLLAFVAPLGLTYSLLSRRVLDIGFALNRAAVFSGVSVVLVGAFVLVEWALAEWLNGISHVANIAVGAALALALGLSMRFVHGKVEHFVDYVMFRRRREDEEAIRRMACEAPYITDPKTLLARSQGVLLQHADASVVSVLLDDGSGRYGTIEENDPVLVRLRSEHSRVDLHGLETAIEGEWAYPMVARGRLIGALVLGPKQSQESYAPDESAAIAQLANSVAGAIDVLASNAPVDSALSRIERRLDGIAAAIAQLPAAPARQFAPGTSRVE